MAFKYGHFWMALKNHPQDLNTSTATTTDNALQATCNELSHVPIMMLSETSLFEKQVDATSFGPLYASLDAPFFPPLSVPLDATFFPPLSAPLDATPPFPLFPPMVDTPFKFEDDPPSIYPTTHATICARNGWFTKTFCCFTPVTDDSSLACHKRASRHAKKRKDEQGQCDTDYSA